MRLAAKCVEATKGELDTRRRDTVDQYRLTNLDHVLEPMFPDLELPEPRRSSKTCDRRGSTNDTSTTRDRNVREYGEPRGYTSYDGMLVPDDVERRHPCSL
jgi:hypothetical protein